MNQNRNVFSEVYGVLRTLGEKYISKIPNDIIAKIERRKNDDYIPNIDRQKALNEQNISKKAISVICYLHLKYWCNSEEERKKLYKILQGNEENELKKTYEIMFKKI